MIIFGPVAQRSAKKYGRLVRSLFFFLSVIVCCLQFAGLGLAEDAHTVITSDKLEYFSASKKYVATGSVKIEKDGAVVEADNIAYSEETSDAIAEGNVRYAEKDMSIKAGRADLNLESKTGVLYDAEIFYKKYNYHLKGKEIEKIGENYYYSPSGSFTTCDSPVPAWCFKGRDVDVSIGERLKARDTSFLIKDLPVFYTPYLWASIITERQTGFLMPVVGQSKSKGIELDIPFYWAISENRDATVVLDEYTRRGIGTGLEYRFVEPGGTKGNWWTYHIRDTELDKDFWVVNGLYENRHSEAPGGFLNVNYVNEQDFYREYSQHRDIRIQRFLESTGELNLPYKDSRFYLLSQYRVDLENDTSLVPQKLPEAGYVLNFVRWGDLMFSSTADAANFWRKDGLSAGRADIYPRLLYSAGKDFVVSQMAALRETVYSFYDNPGTDDNVQRAAFEYDISAHTRLFRNYSNFTHVIEPSVNYHFIYTSKNDLPVFDSTELFSKTSGVELSILNRFLVKGSELLLFRVAQELDTYSGDKPLKMDIALKRPFPFIVEATYDMKEGTLDTVTSELYVKILQANVSFGQRYNRKEDIMMYSTGIDFSLFKSLKIAGQLWYDAKGAGLQDLTMNLKYVRQCWGVRVEAVKRPGDFAMKVMFDLAGLSSKMSPKTEAASPLPYF